MCLWHPMARQADAVEAAVVFYCTLIVGKDCEVLLLVDCPSVLCVT